MSENPGKKKVTIILIFVLVLVVLGFIFFVLGVRSIMSFIQIVLVVTFVLGILFLTAFIFYHIFIKPHKVDVTHLNKERLLQAAKVSKPPMIGDLWVSGDNKHPSFNVGRIVGWTRIQVFNPPKDRSDKGEIANQDVFAVQNVGFPLNLFVDPLLIRISPDDHSELVGDVVLYGFSLIKQSEYFFLNHDMLDTGKIDYNILQEAKRGVMFLMLGDLKQIADLAIGINPEFNMDMQRNKMLPKNVPVQPPVPPAV